MVVLGPSALAPPAPTVQPSPEPPAGYALEAWRERRPAKGDPIHSVFAKTRHKKLHTRTAARLKGNATTMTNSVSTEHAITASVCGVFRTPVAEKYFHRTLRQKSIIMAFEWSAFTRGACFGVPGRGCGFE